MDALSKHVCNCVWLLLVFVVDDIHIPLHVQQCMDHYTEGPGCARKCCLYSNASYAQLPLLEWCNVRTLLVLVLCYVPVVTSTIFDVINYCHRIVQVAFYCILYLFHQGCITKCVHIN